MRVIAGKARRTILETLPGIETRPTTDRIKETLFNVINPYIGDCDFLDLFSGSGAIGIEALSRGAASVTFIENNKSAVSCIKSNLKKTKLEQDAIVLNADAVSCIKSLEAKKQVFDIIFMDPPYEHELEKQILLALSHKSILHENSIIIVEASLETKFDYLDETGFQIYRTKEYKTNKHVFLEVAE